MFLCFPLHMCNVTFRSTFIVVTPMRRAMKTFNVWKNHYIEIRYLMELSTWIFVEHIMQSLSATILDTGQGVPNSLDLEIEL